MVTELLEAGHRCIGHVTDRRRPVAAKLRLATYREVLARWDVPFDSKLVVADDSVGDFGTSTSRMPRQLARRAFEDGALPDVRRDRRDAGGPDGA